MRVRPVSMVRVELTELLPFIQEGREEVQLPERTSVATTVAGFASPPGVLRTAL